MFCVIDRESNMMPIKSGFHTAAQANDWAKRNLPRGQVQLWKDDVFKRPVRYYRYFIKMR